MRNLERSSKILHLKDLVFLSIKILGELLRILEGSWKDLGRILQRSWLRSWLRSWQRSLQGSLTILKDCFVEIVTTSQSINELNYFPNCDTLQARQPFGNYSVLLYLYFTAIIFLIRLLCVTYRFRTTLTVATISISISLYCHFRLVSLRGVTWYPLTCFRFAGGFVRNILLFWVVYIPSRNSSLTCLRHVCF